MASYLRPRRGKKATAIAQLTGTAALKRGEVFFEVPDGGVGTGIGKIKMGDGSTDYSSLPYFLYQLDLSDDSSVVGFTDSSAAESDPYTENPTHVSAIVPTASLKTIFTNLKQLLLNYNSQLTTLNNHYTSLSGRSTFYAGYFEDVSDMKSWISSQHPGTPWVARVGTYSAFGTIFNDYQGGYCGFFIMSYFDTSASNLRFYSLQKGSWNQ